MGVSDDERREIAAKLREQAGYSSTSISMWWQRLQVTVLDEIGFPRPEIVFDTLADLIDRPMCRNAAPAPALGGSDFQCSRCGLAWSFDVGDLEENEFYRCPKCGAEVIR